MAGRLRSVLFAKAGAGKWRGPAGSITTVAPDGVSQGTTPVTNLRDEVDAQFHTTSSALQNWDLYDLAAATSNDAVVYFTCIVEGIWTSGGKQMSVFEIRGAYKYLSGAASVIGTPTALAPWETSASSASFAFSQSGSKIRLTFSGASNTTDWLVSLKVRIYSV